jgi:DNA-binding FadR family transcriptional regulator
MIAHNPIFTALHMALSEWLSEQRRATARAGATFDGVFAEHRAIYEAIAARDAVAAQDAMERHLDAVARLYWRDLGREGAQVAPDDQAM